MTKRSFFSPISPEFQAVHRSKELVKHRFCNLAIPSPFASFKKMVQNLGVNGNIVASRFSSLSVGSLFCLPVRVRTQTG